MSKAYLFRGAEYLRFDIATRALDARLNIADEWDGWPGWQSVDAAVNYGNGKVHFFRGSKYIRFDILTDRIDQEQREIHDFWHGLPDWGRIDAAFNRGDGTLCLMNGRVPVLYDVRSDQAVPLSFALQPVPPEWKKVDATLDWGDGKVWFFRKTRCARYDLHLHEWDFQDDATSDHWAGVPTAWASIDAAVTIDLSAEKMGAALESRLSGKTVGYAYTIHKGGRQMKAAAFGSRIKAVDNNGTDAKRFTLQTQMGIGSITKSLTAMAVVKRLEELEERAIVRPPSNATILRDDWDPPIGRFLPDDWDPPKTSRDVTFKELLTHTSGLVEFPGFQKNYETWGDLQARLDMGVILPLKGKFAYRNTNFCLFRLLLPALYGTKPVLPEMAALSYRMLMQLHVFGPARVQNAELRVTSSEHPYLYASTDREEEGADWYGEDDGDDSTMIAGAGGWKLTVTELGRVLATWVDTELITSKTARDLMVAEKLGGYGDSSINFSHEGSSENGDGQGYDNKYYWFTDDVVITVMSNMTGTPLSSAIKKAHAAG